MTRKELKAALPSGSHKLIAERAGVSAPTLSRFLNGRCENVALEMVVLEYLIEIEKKKQELYNELKSVSHSPLA